MKLIAFPSGPVQTNAYLLICEETRRAAIIDPAQGSAPALIARVKSEGVTVEKYLLTHSHWDHFADLALLLREIPAPVWVHPADAENLRHPGSDRVPMMIPIEPVEPDHFLQEGQMLHVGKLHLQVIHTPGHCPGAVCFYCAESATLISGDTLFKGTIGSLSLPTSRANDMRHSLIKLASLPPDTVVYPGHGTRTTIGAEKENFLSY